MKLSHQLSPSHAPLRGARALLVLLLVVLLTGCAAPFSRNTEPNPEASPSDSLTGQVQEIIRQVVNTLEVRSAASSESTSPTATPATVQIQGASPRRLADSDLEGRLIDLYQQANPATVYIITSTGSGSGFVYDTEGHIVTNNHVIESSRSYEIVFADGARRSARLVGSDADSDLAVLLVDDLPAGVEPLPLAESEDVQVGQFVIAIGNPFGEQGSMSLGIVSGLDRSLRSQRTQGPGYSLPEVIQTDAPINPGNSGGPLLNLNGEVVGVNSAIATTSGSNSGVGFSIPVAAVRRIVPSLIRAGSYEYPYLGISFAEDLTLAEQTALGLSQSQGAYVLDVAAGGPAASAGVVAADVSTGRGGDLVIAIDDQPVNDFSDLNSYLIFHTEVGQNITLTVLRGNRQLDLQVRLGNRP